MRKFLVWFLTKHYFKWVSEDDILTIERDRSGKITGVKHKGRYLELNEIQQFADQAITILDTELWNALTDEIHYTAHLMFIKSKDYEETLSAKLLLRAEQIIKNKLRELKQLAK